MSQTIVTNNGRRLEVNAVSIHIAGDAATGRAPPLMVWGQQGVAASSSTNSMTNWSPNQSHPPEEEETTLGTRQTIQALKRVQAVTMTRAGAILTL